MKPIFETEACGRCGGGGRYSYNPISGSTCFGCGGSGIRLTRRGSAAAAFFRASQEKHLSEVRVGMFVWDDTMGYKARFLLVEAIEPSQAYYIVNDIKRPLTNIKTRRGTFAIASDGVVRCIADEDERQALIAAALAYQATLGTNGKPLKVAS